MLVADIAVIGAGISGLLLASVLSARHSVVVLEQADVPLGKYWLTEAQALNGHEELSTSIDRHYKALDFVAYDGLRATVSGNYHLWDTQRLTDQLSQISIAHGARFLTGHRFYSFEQAVDGILLRANAEQINAKLLIDCMGFGSPIVGAKGVAHLTGYYILHGCEVQNKCEFSPVALDNVLLHRHPMFFELFPTSHGTSHASLILPSRHFKPDHAIKPELNFILQKSHYSDYIRWNPSEKLSSYFGIIPVGRLLRPAIDRIVFFGEAGQSNPAASAVGLTRMLHIYHEFAEAITNSLTKGRLRGQELCKALPPAMDTLNRTFQEVAFEQLLSGDSDAFRLLVRDLAAYPADVVNGLIFADFEFTPSSVRRLLAYAIRNPDGTLARYMAGFLSRVMQRPFGTVR